MLANQKFWLGIALSLCFFQVQAQDYITTRNAPKKAKEAFVEANNHLALNDYANATKGLQKVLKKYPNFINAQLVLGDTYRRQKQYDKAKIHFQKAIELDPDYEPKIYYILGGIAMDSKEYETAEKQFKKFLTYEKINDKLRKKAEKYKGDVIFRPKALANPVPFTPKNMGDQINSTGRDYFPSITADEGLFVYTRQMDPSRSGQEDLYLSQKKDGVWQKSVPLPINTKENEAAQSISADGKLLVFTVCNRREDFGSCDLYFSENINGIWTLPRNLGSSINSGSWESQPSVAPNSDAIYYTRGGTRGQGHKDLMVSYKQADGTWGKAERITSLNTPFDESAPCIHPDGKTLYFSSNGYPGMGGVDLFMTRLQADGTWSEPINLGYPINTEKAEEALSVNLNGDVAYLASDREGGFGSLDIYTFEMPEKMRPKPVTYV
ncbi:MAG: tetratricopeptide repeat protein, partial [Saprospiraceae bacterium]|nr:tetratricopeptide repeat protein [Saprospiraceae bacterium]